MRLAIGSDHAGFRLKGHLVQRLAGLKHEVEDLGTGNEEPIDYPPICAAVARAVASGSVDRGIVLGGSGQGEQIAANKVRGIRAALCNDPYLAKLSRRDNDANVLALGARLVTPLMADEILDVWLMTPFEGGRHARRIGLIAELERDPRGGWCA